MSHNCSLIVFLPAVFSQNVKTCQLSAFDSWLAALQTQYQWVRETEKESIGIMHSCLFLRLSGHLKVINFIGRYLSPLQQAAMLYSHTKSCTCKVQHCDSRIQSSHPFCGLDLCNKSTYGQEKILIALRKAEKIQ